MLMSTFFTGVGVGSIVLSPLSDLLGRKLTLIYMTIAHTIVQFVLIYWPAYEAKLVGYALLGILHTKSFIPFNWMYELASQKHRSRSAAIMCAS
jgi:MFS family permease